MSEQETAEEKASPPQGPGLRLQRAREASGFSREQVAERLHLEVRVIVALEEDDFASLPEPPFVRGYLRAYANQVALPGDELVAAYNDCLGEPAAEGVRPVARVRQASSGDRVVRVATWLIGLSLLMLVAIWWWDGHMSGPASAPAEAPAGGLPAGDALPQEGEVSGGGGEAATAEVVGGEAASPPPQRAAAEAPVMAEVTPTEVPAASAPERVEAPAVSPPVVSGEVAQPVEEAAPPAEPAPSPVADGASSPVAEEATPAAAGEDEVSLRIRFEGDSWVSLRDATGKALLLRVARAGEEHELRGVPPFKVVLGNAPAVELWYRGERFDLGPWTRGKVARFRLGEASSP